jgi:hypothetical protein
MAVSKQERQAILCIIDANGNRCREGLRVAEDIVRLSLRQKTASRGIKELRHGLELGLRRLAGHEELLSARNVAADPGADSMTPGELERQGLSAVLRANLRRSQEALRVLEEISKLIHSGSAAPFKRLRFRCYEIEKELDGRLSKTLARSRTISGKRGRKKR